MQVRQLTPDEFEIQTAAFAKISDQMVTFDSMFPHPADRATTKLGVYLTWLECLYLDHAKWFRPPPAKDNDVEPTKLYMVRQHDVLGQRFEIGGPALGGPWYEVGNGLDLRNEGVLYVSPDHS